MLFHRSQHAADAYAVTVRAERAETAAASLYRELAGLRAAHEALAGQLRDAETTSATLRTTAGACGTAAAVAAVRATAAEASAAGLQVAVDVLRGELAQACTPVPRTGPAALPEMDIQESGLILGCDLVLTWGNEQITGRYPWFRLVVKVTTSRGECLAVLATLRTDTPSEVLAVALAQAAGVAVDLFPGRLAGAPEGS
jgi:hypothetical protein